MRTFQSMNRSLLALAVLLSGCTTVGPNYIPPKLSGDGIPAQWPASADALTKSNKDKDAKDSAAFPWWSELSDSVLDRLIAEAFRTSPSLEAATARLRQSRAMFTQADAAGSPAGGADAGNEWAGANTTSKVLNQSWLSMNASWELDLFGAVKRGVEGAIARADAEQATLADARVSLAADVTDAYLSYRACRSFVTLGKQDVTSREATATLTTASVKEGFTAPYEAIRSKASVAEAKTQLAATRAYCERQENLLARLTGVPRRELKALLADEPDGLDRLPVPQNLSVAIPREALMRRPDIQAAERRLAAASADIGLAEADRYPRIALNGALSYTVSGTGTGALSIGTWSFGPTVSLPLFDGGRRAGAVEMTKSAYEERLAIFKDKARSAVQEVEDALTRYAAAHERAESARLSAHQYRDFFKAVEVRYREGASNLLELEDARRAMLSAEQTFLNVQQERLQAWVALHRATGGGALYRPEQENKGAIALKSSDTE